MTVELASIGRNCGNDQTKTKEGRGTQRPSGSLPVFPTMDQPCHTRLGGRPCRKNDCEAWLATSTS
eukprot:9356315-Prorocentrum_lima.AAC.1